MAILSLITGGAPQRTSFQDASGIDLMLVDATLSITPNYGATATEHPVENGSDVSDHINVKNISMSLEGYASETPIGLGLTSVKDASEFGGTLSGGAAAIGSFAGSKFAGTLGGAVGAVAGGIGVNLLRNSKNKAEVARDFLINLLNARKTFTIVAQNRKYENLIIENLSFPRDPSTGRGLYFTCQLKQIRIVESQVIKIDSLESSVVHSAAANSKLGRQAAKPTTPQRGQSVLVAMGLPGR